MAFAQKRDTVCPGQKLTQLEGPRKAVVEAWELDLICSLCVPKTSSELMP